MDANIWKLVSSSVTWVKIPVMMKSVTKLSLHK